MAVTAHRRARFVPALLVTALMAACGAAGGNELAGRTFLSTAVVADGAPIDLVPGTQVRLTFGADGRIGVNAGCNTMGGTYRLEDGVLMVADGAVTEMGCDPARHAQDDWVFGLLTSSPSVTLLGNELALATGTDSIAFLDREVADPDLGLVGPTWIVTSIISGEAVSSLPVDVVATLAFGADGRVQVTTGCNEGPGAYVADADTIDFSDIAITERACDASAGQVEAAMMAVLGAAHVSYAIEASSLTLMAGTNGLGLDGR
jgi:heat shock protein HslJ